MPTPSPSDSNLLFDLLALHNGLISREQAVDAMQAWVGESRRTMPELLVERRLLSSEDRQRVEQMVELHLERHGGDVESTASSLPAVSGLISTTDERPGERDSSAPSGLGGAQRFRVLKPHASGGLGEVSVALDEQLGREVALKQIRERHADDPHSRARFLREATITGRLEHPGIVPIYGLDVDEFGRPRYAMRFVRGDSLMAAIDRFHAEERPGRDPAERSIALRNLLTRFIAVCQAIAYAHSKRVIHRDIKPANIMLGEYGETLVVDWGLARDLDQHERETRPSSQPESDGAEQLTHAGQLIGTPNFMAPEQARGENELVGASSDVFALGATLFCILTGKAPYRGNRNEVREQALAGRPGPARQLNPRTPAALEAVCARAMSLRPEDRYPSARDLAHEVERWLADEPVQAHSESLGARLRRWAKRNRTLTASAVILLLLAVPLAVALALVSDRARRRADEDRESLRAQSDRLHRISRFYERYVLAAPRPLGKDNTHDVSMRQALDRAIPEIEKTFGNDPEDEMMVSGTLGGTYLTLGEFATAERLLKRAHELALELRGEHDRDTLLIAMSLEQTLINLRKFAQADELLARAEVVARELLGPEDSLTLIFRHDLAFLRGEQGRDSEAERICRELIPIRERVMGKNHDSTLATEFSLACSIAAQGKMTDAEHLLATLVPRYETALGADNHETLRVISQWSMILGQLSQFATAEAIQRDLSPRLAKVLGPEHPATLACRHNHAHSLQELGKVDEADQILKELVPIRSRVRGPMHPDALASQQLLGWGLLQRGKFAEAAPLIQAAAEGILAAHGPDHRETLGCQGVWIQLQAEHEPRKAEQMFLELLPRMDRVLTPEHPMTMTARHNLAHCLAEQGRNPEAEEVLRKLVPLRERIRGPKHPDSLASLFALSGVLAQRGKLAEAERMAQAAAEGMLEARGPDHPERLIVAAGWAYMVGQRRPTKAQELFDDLLPTMDRVLTPEHPVTMTARHNLAFSLASQANYADAEAILRKLVPQRSKARGPKHPDTLFSMHNLADCLARQGKLDEAERTFQELLPLTEEKAKEVAPLLPSTRMQLMGLYVQNRKFANAVPLLRRMIDEQEKLALPDDPMLATLQATLGWALLETGKPAEAEPLLRKSLTVRKKALPAGNWQTANTQSLLGGALAAQKKYDEAEKLVLTGFRVLSVATGVPRERITEAHARVVKLYDDWGKPDKAAEWRKKAPSSERDQPKKDK